MTVGRAITERGLAGFKTIASHKLRVEHHGKGAHAAGDPWDGIDALDAAVAAYNNISMLRQQIKADERIYGAVESGGEAPNVIPHYTRMNWNIRSATSLLADALLVRAKACFKAVATATGSI
ncbi:peptidase M20, dimerization domain-containing protein [Ilyonectria destructans]|nr:peptidase M20, dimerization domain-containing protein [Ilyonectria destructans]